MHLGNLRTALFNVLLAAKQKGHFLLRIEDTDEERSQETYTQMLCDDLRWLGLHWQEGIDLGGEHGPYAQSMRSDIYAQYYQQLIDQKDAFWCFCSEADLAQQRQSQKAQGKPPRYDGRCRHLSDDEVAEKKAAGQKPALRFRMPDQGQIVFDDCVKGQQKFKSADIGDFIIQRSDGSAAFMFCNALDDSLMNVTHALRGEDHLTNTPRQMAICQALKIQPPQYGHLALIVGNDGSPFSKRHGSQSVCDLREQGFLPIAILNYLARLGHTYTQDTLMDLSELSEYFCLDRLGKAPAKFDHLQLHYWQKTAVAALSETDFERWAREFIPPMGDSIERQSAFIAMIRPNITHASDVKIWSKVMLGDEIDFSEEQAALILKAGKGFLAYCLAAFTEYTDYAQALNHLKTLSGLNGKALFQPLRLALTGQLGGPDLSAMTAFMGKEKILARLKATEAKISI